MKKYRLRKWVEYLLIAIAIISFIIMGSDCEDFTTFIIVHLIAVSTFTLSLSILSIYEH